MILDISTLRPILSTPWACCATSCLRDFYAQDRPGQARARRLGATLSRQHSLNSPSRQSSRCYPVRLPVGRHYELRVTTDTADGEHPAAPGGRPARSPAATRLRWFGGHLAQCSPIAGRGPIPALAHCLPTWASPRSTCMGSACARHCSELMPSCSVSPAQGTVTVRIITGHGGGVLKQAIGDPLAHHPSVAQVKRHCRATRPVSWCCAQVLGTDSDPPQCKVNRATAE